MRIIVLAVLGIGLRLNQNASQSGAHVKAIQVVAVQMRLARYRTSGIASAFKTYDAFYQLGRNADIIMKS